MSSRARRVKLAADLRPFEWMTPGQAVRSIAAAGSSSPEPAAGASDSQQQARLAALEREAFAKGYEQGERAGAEAANKRADAMVRRLADTIEELTELRRTMIRETEQQMVRLALAVARRIVRREVAVDSDLTLTLARVALERLGDSAAVTIRLHPEDHGRLGHKVAAGGSSVSVVADPGVARGGCRVESDFGFVDASIDAQLGEIARAVLADSESEGELLTVRHDA